MDLAIFALTFAAIFLVELPDKTFIAALVLSRRVILSRLLLDRQRNHALRSKLDPMRDDRDHFCLFGGAVLIAPEGLGGGEPSIGGQSFPIQ